MGLDIVSVGLISARVINMKFGEVELEFLNLHINVDWFFMNRRAYFCIVQYEMDGVMFIIPLL